MKKVTNRFIYAAIASVGRRRQIGGKDWAGRPEPLRASAVRAWTLPESLTAKCLCHTGQGCLGESESTAEAAGRGQVQPRHAGLHHERGL